MLFANKLWFFLRLLVLLSVSQPGFAAEGGLGGDAEAIKRMFEMLDNLGGRQIWANAKSLYTMEKARHPNYGDGIIATFWRDLEHPAERVKFKHPNLDMSYAWNEAGGWVSKDGETRDLVADEVNEKVYRWRRDLYILYHDMAIGDRTLTLETLDPNGFRVLNEKNEKLGDFRLTPNSELYYWQQYGLKESKVFLYGPHKSFGKTRFPDWETSSDGDWGAYFVQVLPSTKPFDAHVTMSKPNPVWQGGAINKGCDRN